MSEFGIFGGKNKPNVQSVWNLYNKGRKFNNAIGLDDTVRTNENFFVGKQWEGVQSNGLPTPVFNILKRDVCFVVSTITSDNIKVQATPLAATANTHRLIEPARIFTEECEAVMERNNLVSLIREFARDAAVRGDGCLYTYWDAEADTGTSHKGAICTETIENNRVYFGNPNSRRVQSQPFIQIESREIVRELRERAKANGSEEWESITPDSDNTTPDSVKLTDDKVTLILTLWRNKDTGTIWGYESTQNCEVRKAWDTGLRRYPIVWLNWDYVQDCYHGQAMLTGLIPNQIFINKIWAMSMLSIMTTAYPKIVYDKTRIPKWTNRVGEAIGINGGDVASAAKIIDPAQISPQIAQFIELAVEQTNQNLGATSVALGDTRPDNTSAIIALQRAAATPSEITKQNIHKCIEELALVYLEFMAEYYGTRMVDTEPAPELAEVYAFAGQEMPAEVPTEFDFSEFKKMPMQMKLDVGASSYYSEIASIQTLDNLLMQNKITIDQYLERIPDGYIPDRRGLLNEIRRMGAAQGTGGMMTDGIAETGEPEAVPVGGGYAALQRKIASGEA
jgi:hypothetical protein